MALPNHINFEIRTGGNDTNGGGFLPGASGTDYSQTNSKRTATGTDDSTTDAVANGTTTITSATANFTTAIIGNAIYLQGGTGGLTAGWYYVSARASATSITVDRTVAAGTGITMNIGGAIASVGTYGYAASAIPYAIGWVEAGTYNVNVDSFNISGNAFRTGANNFVFGYNATRGDFPNGASDRPVFNCTAGGAGSQAPLYSTGGSAGFASIDIDANNIASCGGVWLADTAWAWRIRTTDTSNSGTWPPFGGGAPAVAVECESVSHRNGLPAFASINCYRCVARDGAASTIGFSTTGSANLRTFVECIADTMPTGFQLGACALAIGCVAYEAAGAGFAIITAPQAARLYNCIAVGSGTYGFQTAADPLAIIMAYCAGYDNTSGDIQSTPIVNINFVTLTAQPFTNPGAGDFSLNATAGGGADLIQAGYPSVPGLTTITLPNIGVWQDGTGIPSGGGESFGAAFG